MRFCRVTKLALCAWLGCTVLAAPPASAQENLNPNWGKLSPDLREQKRKQYFQNLPESQQQQLREHQRKFQSLPSEDKLALCRRFHSQNGYYPPACQNLIGP